MKLSKPYLELLAELNNDARQPLSHIARKLGISQQLLGYRMKSLLRRKIVSEFITLINFQALGYTAFKTMIQLSNITGAKYRQIIYYLKKHKAVWWLVECGGRYDLIMIIKAKNIIHFNQIIKKIIRKFPDQIQNYDVLTTVELIVWRRDYFSKDKKRVRRAVHIGGHMKEVRVDELNYQILCLLSRNARISAAEISEKVGISSNSVIKRIETLKKKGIILSFIPFIHLEYTPYSSYKACFKLQNVSPGGEKDIIQYLSKRREVISALKIIGQWNFEIDIEVESREALLDFTRSFRDKYRDVIKEAEVIPLYHEHKVDSMPYKR